MNIPSKEFSELIKSYNQVSKHFKSCLLTVNSKSSGYPDYKENFTLQYSKLRFKNVAGMHGFIKTEMIPTAGMEQPSWGSLQFRQELMDATTNNLKTLDWIVGMEIPKFNTLRLSPSAIPADYQPQLIKNPPIEVTEGDYTYRLLTGNQPSAAWNTVVVLIARNDEALYDYLDQGFYLMTLNFPVAKNKTKLVHIVANQYDINVAHIFAMCKLQPKLTEMLRNGCFINAYEAELLRLKMQKKLADHNKLGFKAVSALIEQDYKQNTTLIAVGKLLDGSCHKANINNIAFSSSSASYERVSIEANDLLTVLSTKLNFNGEFDIYGVTSIYGLQIQKALDDKSIDKRKEKQAVEEPNTLVLDEHAAQLEEENVDEPASTKEELPSFTINGITITPAISQTGQRYINNIRVNKDEIAQAIHRASCYHDQDNYKLFLQSISRLCIRWHDVIAGGLPVKIHERMTHEEYDDPIPSLSAPALKFIIDPEDKYVKLKISEERAVRVSLGKLLGRVATINKRTNNKEYFKEGTEYRYYRRAYRNNLWCAEELAKAFIDCCTFKRKVVQEDTGQTTEVAETLINKDDIVALLNIATEKKKAMIARSKEFLATAVKVTGAEEITFLGKPAYKIKGSLREYAVIIATAKVYDYDTKQYRCIVNDRHYVGAGYDDIAARLLALKNDSVMQNQIGTLRGAAQPNAEHAHQDQLLIIERESNDVISEIVDNALLAVK